MKEYPLVSLIIPCYNHTAFLDDCMRSILRQDYPRLEIFICDDCSSDGSYERLLGYETALRERFGRVSIRKNESNLGVTKNLNQMLRQAGGEYIKLLASDDFLADNAISSFVAFMQAHEETDVVFSNGYLVSEDQHIGIVGESKIYPTAPDLELATLAERIFRSNELSAPCAFLRKAVFDRFGLYDERYAIEDLEFWLRLLRGGGCRFAFLDQPLLYYRRNANSITSLVVNEKTDSRMLRFYSAELGILEAYRDLVPEELYAEAILWRLLAVYSFSVDNRLPKTRAFAEEKLKASPLWGKLKPGVKGKYRFVYVKQIVKKLLYGSG